MSILVIDDDVDLVEVNRLTLEAAGFDVSFAYDTEGGLAAFDAFRPDVVFVDLVMEHADSGFNLCRQIDQHPHGAAVCIVMAVTDPDAPVHRRASMILVPTDATGYRLRRNTPIMGHAGIDLFSHGEVSFEDCRVPAGNLLGARGDGFRLAQARLGPGRIHHCMRWLGICGRALELMVRRASSRAAALVPPLSP